MHRGLVRIGPPAALLAVVLAVVLAAGPLLAGCSGPAPAGPPGATPATAVTAAVPRGAVAESTFTVDDGAELVVSATPASS